MCCRKSCQCAWRIDLNDNCHAAFIQVSNCITLHTDLVHMVEILENACGTSRNSRRRSWIRNGEEVELYLPKTSEMMYMPSIAGRKRRNVIGPRYFSYRLQRLQLIRNWEVTKLLDSNDNAYKYNNRCQKCVYDSWHTIIECTKAVLMWLMCALTEYQWF
jgi:hypothetical protein